MEVEGNTDSITFDEFCIAIVRTKEYNKDKRIDVERLTIKSQV